MEQLIEAIAAKAGLDRQTAKAAVGHILAYIRTEGSGPDVRTMLDQMPGVDEAIREADTSQTGRGGLMGGLMGAMSGQGTIMALGSKLMGLGLDIPQIRTVANELVEFANQRAGKDTVDRALRSVPGLGDYL